LFFSLPHTVYAHFPKTDGTITVVLHVDPNDDPIPGEQAHLYFLFKDTDKKFQLSSCNCIVTVSEDGKEILHKQLTETRDNKASIWGANIPFTFPDRNVYQITLSGNSIPQDSFQSFKLSWYFRVDENNILGASTQENSSDTDPNFIYFAVGFLSIPLIGGLGIFALFKKANSEENKTKGGEKDHDKKNGSHAS
jgi:hypothetical protein